MNPSELILLLRNNPLVVEFSQVIAVIAQHYSYKPTQFSNGSLVNTAGTNEGSCKIFYFAQIHQLNETDTLHLFGDYYHKDVVLHPNNNDHGNIRTFMTSGWQGINFEGVVLTKP